jgi:hypothetical protein
MIHHHFSGRKKGLGLAWNQAKGVFARGRKEAKKATRMLWHASHLSRQREQRHDPQTTANFFLFLVQI